MQWSEGADPALPVPPHGHQLTQGIAAIERPPHMSEALLVARLDTACDAARAFDIDRHVGLAGGGHHGAAGQVAVQRKKALEVHVQVLTDGLAVGVPATNLVRQAEGQRVD